MGELVSYVEEEEEEEEETGSTLSGIRCFLRRDAHAHSQIIVLIDRTE